MSNKAINIDQLEIHQLQPGIHRFWLKVVSDSFSAPVRIPVMLAKGQHEGPVLGISSALHGNEINGIPVIQQIFKEIEVEQLSGTILAIPVVNIPSFFRKKRRFTDNVDLNHIMPGKAHGNSSQIYAYNFFEKVIRNIQYLIDLHTASFGRINSYYIRADMTLETSAMMAKMQNPQIILHNPASDGTLRGAAEAMGIPAITLELGNPNVFQPQIIHQAVRGIYNVLNKLQMYSSTLSFSEKNPIVCQSSKWLYTKSGGLLYVHPSVTDIVEKGDLIAHQENIFGDCIINYYAPNKGIIIGKSTSPVNKTGGRILHLGFL